MEVWIEIKEIVILHMCSVRLYYCRAVCFLLCSPDEGAIPVLQCFIRLDLRTGF